MKSPFLESNLSPDRFEIVLKSISDGVFSVDDHWNLTCFNDAAVSIMGIPRDQALGRKCYEILRTNICKQACALRYTVETGKPVINLVVNTVNAQNKTIPISISTALLKDKNGKIIGGVETFRDLSLVEHLRKEITKQYSFADIVSKSPLMEQIFSVLPTIAFSDSTVLIYGESGTGKELLARAIHNLSNRQKFPFVIVNCGTLPDTLLESELFGYKAGAFTGAVRDKPGKFTIAEKGTIFLDEISEIPLALQVKLLRVIQEKTYEPLGDVKTKKADVRFIVATNRRLLEQVKKDLFREDLYYRLNIIRLELPPLRKRSEDIPLLIEHFISKFSALMGKDINSLSSDVIGILLNYDYPGNIRELQNIIEHAFVLCPSGVILKEHIPFAFQEIESGPAADLGSRVAHFETQVIREILKKHNWNRLQAAKELGIHKTTLFKKIHKHGIALPNIDGRTSSPQKK
ncbi:sigma-54 interaction domain-containing protein [candidate division CSSED10-310 bacterium]|uniref:Sigma-54 interaction domain-containing protein n=1 Tax=candidate division CSSED10-310 bacterium TaxID=2855610 RepID=A0ABV6Z0W5_UNCC1